VQHQRDKQRIEEAPGLTVARAGEVLADLIGRPLTPGLYVVATPIGNLADISLRALAVLARADLIAAEDTRHSKKLLFHFGLGGKLTPYHEHNAERERPKLLARLRAGQSVALISDAGTPLISDPGYKLVRDAVDAELLVISIPGPSATLAALTSAGLPTDTFLFAGFLPPKSSARRARLEQLKSVPATLILFESSSRLAKSLADMADLLGSREAAVAKELTKLHESVTRGRLDRLAAEFADRDPPKGEFVVVVAPPAADQAEASDEKIVEQLEKALKLQSFRDAVRSVAEVLNVSRARVYELGLALKRE
jgi:16S rRNA (cytidine1402-2'-O)-methyltransferase